MQWPLAVSLTIPCTGWLEWSIGSVPEMVNDTWLPRLLSDPNFQRVKILRLELECIEQHVPHVVDIIEDLKRKYCTVDTWRINAESGKEIMAWIGSPEIGAFYLESQSMPPDPCKLTKFSN